MHMELSHQWLGNHRCDSIFCYFYDEIFFSLSFYFYKRRIIINLLFLKKACFQDLPLSCKNQEDYLSGYICILAMQISFKIHTPAWSCTAFSAVFLRYEGRLSVMYYSESVKIFLLFHKDEYLIEKYCLIFLYLSIPKVG